MRKTTGGPGNRAAVGSRRSQRFGKLSCEAGDGCGFLLYTSRRQLQRAGAFACPVCGHGGVIPDAVEDARLVLSGADLDAHPAMVEYRRELEDIGRAPQGRPAEEIAMERIGHARRDRAQRNWLAAFLPAPSASRA